MAHYAVEERRIAAGRLGDYLDVIEAIHRSLVSARGRLTMRAYVSESEPDAVLAVSGWAQRRDAAGAEQMLQPRQMARLSELTRETQPSRWFVTEREITTFIGQPTVAAASLMTIAAADVPAVLAWARRGQNRAAEMDEVIATQVLRAEDEPGRLLFLVEYRDEAARAAVRAMVAA
ncbi:MAG TPA: hypothetical protein VGL23_08690, partial [Chloroflexota bacterium]